MTDIIEPHGPQGQGNAIGTVDRKPWNPPRLIDLDDRDAQVSRPGCNVAVGDPKRANYPENTYTPKCTFFGTGNARVS